ncbi:hypothetical protein M0802_011925 [Mischocyttarus mexicanus]|nr:hypothetical protein M0802_011925 [Mischocyttarus mexicanus]
MGEGKGKDDSSVVVTLVDVGVNANANANANANGVAVVWHKPRSTFANGPSRQARFEQERLTNVIVEGREDETKVVESSWITAIENMPGFRMENQLRIIHQTNVLPWKVKFALSLESVVCRWVGL